MVDEQTGDKYARAVGQKGVGESQEWVVRDLSKELNSWGHTRGSRQ